MGKKLLSMRNMEKEEIRDVEDVLSGSREKSMTTITVKEEMYTEESSDVKPDHTIDTVLINSKETDSYGAMEKEPESVNDIGTPFFFVGVKMENADDYESEALCGNSETKYSCEEYTSHHEGECYVDDQNVERMLPTNMSNTASFEVKPESVKNIVCCKSDFQTNEDTSGMIVGKCKFNSRSEVRQCDMGHSSNEFIRGIECQEYPILRVKKDKKTDKQIAGNILINSVADEEEQKERGLNKMAAAAEEDGGGEGKRPLACRVCAACFPSRSKLLAHVRTHTGEKPFSCAQCNASYSQKGTLRRHLRRHSDDKPFVCEACGAAFARKDGLKMHLATHAPQKPFACALCAASFSAKGALKRHLRFHSGEKPFSCVVCRMSFALKYHMRRHMLIHTHQRAFSCHICEASFARKDRVLVHLRMHSRQTPH